MCLPACAIWNFMEEYIKTLEKLSLKALKKGEVPIACIIVKDNKIISKSYNMKENKKDPMLHAEIIAIRKACKKLKDWRLNNCEMYVTLEPCKMCKEIIKESRIRKVIYILESKACKKEVTKYEKYDNKINNFDKIIEKFFKGIR